MLIRYMFNNPTLSCKEDNPGIGRYQIGKAILLSDDMKKKRLLLEVLTEFRLTLTDIYGTYPSS